MRSMFMKTKIKKVYYCDFCKKKMFQVSAMENHEKHCTANLHRQCKMCDKFGGYTDYKKVLKELRARYIIYESQNDNMMLAGITSYSINWVGEKITRQTLHDLTDGCPNCMLTLLRQLDDIAKPEDFNYKKEIDGFWAEQNKESLYY